MSKVQKEEQNDTPQQHSPPPINSGNIETPEHIQESNNTGNPTNNPHHKPTVYKRVVTFFGKNTNQTKIANLLSLGMLIVTGILALYTWKLFNQTQVQSKAATRSANAAITADSIAKIALDNQILAKKQSDITDVERIGRERKTFNLQKTIDSSQIEAFKEAKKDFEVGHSPYIEVDRYNITQNNLEVIVENKGTQIAWILENGIAIKADTVNKRFKTFDELRKWIKPPKRPFNLQTLASINKPIGFMIPLDTLPKKDIEDVKKGKKVLYIRTLIYYFNPTNLKYMVMENISTYRAPNGEMATLLFTYRKIKKYPL